MITKLIYLPPEIKRNYHYNSSVAPNNTIANTAIGHYAMMCSMTAASNTGKYDVTLGYKALYSKLHILSQLR